MEAKMPVGKGEGERGERDGEGGRGGLLGRPLLSRAIHRPPCHTPALRRVSSYRHL